MVADLNAKAREGGHPLPLFSVRLSAEHLSDLLHKVLLQKGLADEREPF